MAYNPEAQTLIIGGDIEPSLVENIRSQITADVLTTREFEERERVLKEQANIEAQQADIDAGVGSTDTENTEGGINGDGDAGDGFSAPDQGEIDGIEVAGADTTPNPHETDGSGESEGDVPATSEPEEGNDQAVEGEPDADASPEAADGNEDEQPSSEDNANDPTGDDSVDPPLENENNVDDVDEEEMSEEDLAVEDELNEPNAAFEHAHAGGAKELSRYLYLGAERYKRRVRRLRNPPKDPVLAQETIQMEVAERQKLIRRLFYVKPADTGYTSKMQTFISSIDNPNEWIAFVDPQDIGTEEQQLTRAQIEEALKKAGVEMFDSVESLANAVNAVQKAITEPGAV